MRSVLFIVFALSLMTNTAHAENSVCGTVAKGHQGAISEWPNEPVDFDCRRGINELSLCILNRTGIEWLPNAGEQFAAINDGEAVYALTRDTHPAHPMIVRREVQESEDGQVYIETTACGYGDKVASDQLIEDYKALDEKINDDLGAR